MITKDMTIMDAIGQDQKVAGILQAFGMHCLGCAMASGETLEEAAAVHGFSVEELLAKINE